MTPDLYADASPGFVAKVSTSAFVVGPHSRVSRNGLLFNDRMASDGTRAIELYRVTGWTGFGKSEITASSQQRPQQHGAISQPSWYGTRTATLTGQIVAGSYPTLLNMTKSLQDSLSDLSELVTVISALVPDDPSDSFFTQPDWQFLSRVADYDVARDIQQSDLGGVLYRNFTVALFASDPFYYSVDLHTINLVPEVVSETAFTFDLFFDLEFDVPIDENGVPAAAGNTIDVTNAGNFEAPVILRFNGPMSSVRLANNANGQYVALTQDVAAGAFVEIDTQNGTVRDQDGNSVAYVRNTVSDWMVLRNGVNQLALGVSDFDVGASVDVTWRDVSISA